MDTTAKKLFVLFRRKDGNFGIVSSRAFFNKIGGNKAKQFLECTEINQSDIYEDLQNEIQAITAPKKAVKVNEPTPEELDAVRLKMTEPGFNKSRLKKREKEVLAFIEGGSNE